MQILPKKVNVRPKSLSFKCFPSAVVCLQVVLIPYLT